MGVKNFNGINVFEEHVFVFSASTDEDVYIKAKKGSKQHSMQDNNRDNKIYSEQVSYRLNDEPLVDGYEGCSEIFETNESLTDFYYN